jgi:hypothetical protein
MLNEMLQLSYQGSGHDKKMLNLHKEVAKLSAQLHDKERSENELEMIKSSLTSVFINLKMQVFISCFLRSKVSFS